jgi:formate dehydrogenase major subunit
VNWWSNRGKYIASYLKAIYGDKATKENDFCYSWLPKLDEGMKASWLHLFYFMFHGKFDGFFAWGQNPACSSPAAKEVRTALSRLKWLVNFNLYTTRPPLFGDRNETERSRQRSSSFPAAPRLKKKGAYRIQAAGPSGATRPLSLPDNLFPTPRSSMSFTFE